LGTQERRERDKERRKNEIVDAAEKLFLIKGYLETTMDDVAREAELSKGTLYLYFTSKEDLYHAIVLRGMEALTAFGERVAGEDMRGIDKVMALLKTYQEFLNERPDYFTILTYTEIYNISNEDTPIQQKLKQVTDTMLKLINESIQSGIADGSIRTQVDPVQAAIIVAYSYQSILRLCTREREFQNAFSFNPQNLIQTFSDFVYQSLKA
jgi:Transcriptional regulator